MHKLQMYEDLRDMLEREVKDIQKKGEMDVQALDNLYKLMTAIKVTDKCIEREMGEQGGGSNTNRSYGYAGAGNISNDYSMNRGGYSREGGSNDYSRMMPYYAMDAGMANANAANAMANAANAMANAMGMANASNARGGSNERGGSNDGGGSNAGGGSNDGMSNARRGRDGDSDGRYNESRESRDSSNRRGSYESYDGRSYEYSRDNSRKKMIQKLETLMDDTMSENERKAIMECIEKIK